MNYLELVQRACAESGTIPNSGVPGSSSAKPGSIASASGMEAKFAMWVNDAWADVQRNRTDWRWMRRPFDVALVAGDAEYAFGELGLSRHGNWMLERRGRSATTIYLTPADEAPLGVCDYATMLEMRRGTQTQARPLYVSINDVDHIAFWPTPDQAYRVKGWFQRSVQNLANNTDTPECPANYHMLIVYRALLKAINYDEAMGQFAYWAGEEMRIYGELVRDQVDQVYWRGPLA